MTGHLRSRSPGSWEIRYSVAGRVHTTTFRGGKKAAQARLRELLVAVDRGVDIEPRKITIAQLVRERIALWRSENRITARTEESYATMANLIDASLGHIALPRLTTRQIEQWHQTLRARGLFCRHDPQGERAARPRAGGRPAAQPSRAQRRSGTGRARAPAGRIRRC